MEIPDLHHADVAGLDDDAFIEAFTQVFEALNHYKALAAVMMQDMQYRCTGVSTETLSYKHGYRNGREFARQLSGASMRTIRSLERLGKHIKPRTALTGEELPPAHPYVANGLESGQLSTDSARHILRTLTRLEHCDPNDLDDVEKTLVQNATGTDLGIPDLPQTPYHADEIKQMCDLWELALDPDGTLPPEEQVLKNRSLHLGPLTNGLIPISGNLIPETATLLQNTIDAIITPRHTKTDDKVSEGATYPQKLHDAFTYLIQQNAQNKNIPTQGGTPVTVIIEVKAQDLENNTGIATLHAHDGTTIPQPIHVAKQALCTGATEIKITGKNGRIIGLGHTGRTFNHHQRLAITTRDKGCIMPGCTTKPNWCEIHHIQEHAQGGPTHTNNAATLCWYHHRYLHTNGWTITMKNGKPHPTPPPGKPLHHRLHPPPPKNRPQPNNTPPNHLQMIPD